MVDMRKPITADEILKEAVYFIYLYEPSTDWRSLRAVETFYYNAGKQAKALVDDACKTEGWIYKRFGKQFLPVGYYWLQGDGEVVYKSIISDHIFLVEESEQTDGDVILPGWYFVDEAEQGHGPFSTLEETQKNLDAYAEALENG